MIAEVVTVGSPWTDPRLTAFRSGLSADALRVLERFVRADAPRLRPAQRAISATPLEILSDVVRHSLVVARDDGSLPNAGVEPRRGGLACRAVFGSMSEDTIRSGITALVEDGLSARFEAAPKRRRARGQLRAAVGVDVPCSQWRLRRQTTCASLDMKARAREHRVFQVDSARRYLHVALGVTDGW